MFKHQHNFEFDETIHAQTPDPKSVTVPDMSYSVRELLQKFTSGGIPPIQNSGTYDEETDFEDAIPLDNDLIDLQEAREKVYSLKTKLKVIEAENKRKKAEKIKADIEAKRLKEAEIKKA